VPSQRLVGKGSNVRKKGASTGKAPYLSGCEIGLPHGEVHSIEPNRITIHLAVAVLLVVDGNAVPACLAWGASDVEVVSDAVQGDGLVQQIAAGSSLRLNHKVVPGIVYRVAWNSRSNPLLVDVVVGIPLVSTSDSAFVTPDESLTARRAHELVDVKLKSLGIRQVGRVKINVLNEVMSVVGQRLVGIRQPLCRKGPYEVVVPQKVGVWMCAPYRLLGRATAQRRG